ncbi:MAG: pantoate--beta-alanine ligase [Bacteroidaceae bacterium]|nr:pantoate--beta-alanine ligase [Bacteroidaceae bacterium]
MKVITTVSELKEILDNCRKAGKTIGLVPTMGALHEGHASLVRRSVHDNDITVVSDFVNPTQFNDKNDLQNYPRCLDADCSLLDKEGAQYVFAPSVEEMYPEPDNRQFDFTPLDKVMEGPNRPGHFNGVAQIVSKLFYAVEPDRAYFGEKDFQQLAIIREMVRQLNLKVEIVGCPIVREEDGMALSSRNMLLSKAERKLAANISRTLFESRIYASQHTLALTRKHVIDTINSFDGLEVEYYEIVDGNTLQPIDNWDSSSYIVGCVTVRCGKVRLIDNIKYKE